MSRRVLAALLVFFFAATAGAQQVGSIVAGARRPAPTSFPVVQSTATQDGGSANSVSVTLPSGSSSGDLILIALDSRGSTSATWTQTSGTTGWTECIDDRSSAVYFKEIGASEPTPSFDCTETDSIAVLSYRITGHADPGTDPPECSTMANGSSNNPDSPSHSPSAGSAKHLWITYVAINGVRTVSAVPTNYGSDLYETSGSGGGGTAVASAQRDLEASTEDPGQWTISGSSAWNGVTINIEPEP